MPNFDDKSIPGADKRGFWQRFKDWFSSFVGGGPSSGGGNYTQGGAGAGGNPGTLG